MSEESPFPNQAPISRRALITVGAGAAGAAVVGMSVAGLMGDGANSIQGGDGTGGLTPTETPSTLSAAATAPPTETLSTPPDEEGVIGFEDAEGGDDSTPDAEETVAADEPASTPAADAVDPATILEEVTIAQLREYLDGGAFTIAELVTATLARIEELDGGETELNAVITLNPDAETIAAELDTELAAGSPRGVLHGIPVLLKDIIATGDQMPNTAGSLAMEENVAVKDSYVAARLREAGAVILGKTNLTEFSNFAGGYQTSGYSSLGGITVNPYNLNKSASGSSTGSAVAVAASYVPVAIGAEYDGSIIVPAAQCGVVGVKPTVGLIGRSGVIPIGFTRDSLGPMARTVTDAAIALEVLAGVDPDDPGRTVGAETAPWAAFDTDPVPQPGEGDYTSKLSADALKGKKIGVANIGPFDEGSQALFEAALALIEEAGAELVDVSVGTGGGFESYLTGKTEFKWGLQSYLDTYTPDGPMKSIQDIVTWSEEHAEEAMQNTDMTGLTDAIAAGSVEDQDYLDNTAALVHGARDEGIDLAMDGAGVDALIAPTSQLSVDVWSNEFKGSSSNIPSLAGYPCVTLPIGLSDDLPGGINFFGRAFSEADLLAFAFALEQLLPPRAVPTYIPREE